TLRLISSSPPEKLSGFYLSQFWGALQFSLWGSDCPEGITKHQEAGAANSDEFGSFRPVRIRRARKPGILGRFSALRRFPSRSAALAGRVRRLAVVDRMNDA
ncbi:MAG: hypothetical protein K2X72_26245, partial [Reyranella sp.]|nr:hypothetical protein [Reyranella sp.]